MLRTRLSKLKPTGLFRNSINCFMALITMFLHIDLMMLGMLGMWALWALRIIFRQYFVHSGTKKTMLPHK
jgi:hypothetical protein